MHYITENSVPAWYEIDFNKDKIIVTVPSEVMDYLKEILYTPLLIADFLQHQMKLPNFHPPTEEKWGFNKVIISKQEKNRIKLICALPVIKRFHDLDKNRIYFWRDSLCISASLEILFKALRNYEKTTNADFPQILTIELHTNVKDNAMGINAELSHYVCRWIASMPDNSESKEIINAMIGAYTQMYASKRSILDRFSALLRHPGRIDLMCPGDRCELNPEQYYEKPNQGYSLWPHNVDNPFQQLTLLVGLAKLYQLVKCDILSKTPTC